MMDNKKSSSNKPLIIVLSVLCVIILGLIAVIVYLYLRPAENIATDSIEQTTGETDAESYAAWTDCPGGYICYDANGAGGTTAMANQSASASSSVTLRASNFSYTDHGFLGWSTSANPTIGTDTIYGPMETITTPSTLASEGLKLYAVWLEKSSAYTMQTFTADICSSTLTAATYDSSTGTITTTANTFIALEDTRDGEVYAVARLTDGNCWMLENLRLDNTATISSSNTHNPISTFTALGTPSNYSDSTTWCNSDSSSCDDQSMLDTTNTINASTTTTTSDDVAYLYGNYYNWYSATAGNGTYSMSSGSTSGDICPSNWKLPMGYNNAGSGGFQYLSTSMGGLGDDMYGSTTPTGATMSARLRSFPNNFLYSGDRYSSYLDLRGSYGVYWSSTTNNSNIAYELLFSSSNVYPSTGISNKYYGRTVRCLAGS